ncbi:FAD-dependent oxidoreductase [Nocardia sp. R6R-6]|uniref:FAD-dependent oxidoreductase n=1 Tax=Nocardia sp. R6R-6 TaxID=3459303 RepID=UPI00403DB69F
MTAAYAIVGANLGGGRAAQALRRNGFDGDIHLIGAESHPPYDRPPLSKDVLIKGHDPHSVYLSPEEDWAALGIKLRLSTTVERIDRSGGELVTTAGERIKADKVLLCTGGHLRRLQLPGTELNGVEYLRTIEDSIAVRDRIAAGVPVVIIGGGFIGAEVAACAREAGCEVTLIEIEDVPLWRVLGRRMGQILTQIHRDAGVRVLTKTSVERIGGTTSVTHVITSTGERIEAGLVLVGIGLVPATELAGTAGLAVGNGILVNEFCETSVPSIYAAGDVASQPSATIGERVRVESWQNAQNQAAAAAASMLGRRTAFHEVPWFWSDQYDLNVQMSGQPDPLDDVVFRGDPESRSFTAFYLRDGALRAAIGINQARDIKRTKRYIEAGAVIDPHQLADPSVDLRQLTA